MNGDVWGSAGDAQPVEFVGELEDPRSVAAAGLLLCARGDE